MTELNFSDLVKPAEVDKKTALRITVLGGGSFGTAMANLAVRNGCDTMIWIRDQDAADDINRSHVQSVISKRLFVIVILFWLRYQAILSVMCLNKFHPLLLHRRLFR